jgi:MFS transporter, SP family, xylose:H+ symportor
LDFPLLEWAIRVDQTMHPGTVAAETKLEPHYHAPYVGAISVVAALGGLLFGYDWVVIGGAKPFYESYFRLDTARLVGWANSCALVGCLIGSITSGVVADRLGRKRLLILAGFLFAISSVLTGWAPAFTWFVLWRIAGGIAIGIASNVSPLYIAEVSPAAWRGRLVSMNQLAIVVGILAAQIVNWSIAGRIPEGATVETIRQSWNGHWAGAGCSRPSLFLPWCSSSPRYLFRRVHGGW